MLWLFSSTYLTLFSNSYGVRIFKYCHNAKPCPLYVTLLEDGVAFKVKMQQRTATLKEQMQKASNLDEAIKVNLKKIGYEL